MTGQTWARHFHYSASPRRRKNIFDIGMLKDVSFLFWYQSSQSQNAFHMISQMDIGSLIHSLLLTSHGSSTYHINCPPLPLATTQICLNRPTSLLPPRNGQKSIVFMSPSKMTRPPVVDDVFFGPTRLPKVRKLRHFGGCTRSLPLVLVDLAQRA
jgi:hypothetical protein